MSMSTLLVKLIALARQVSVVAGFSFLVAGQMPSVMAAEGDNLLNQNFNPVSTNDVWAGDITYLRTGEDWIVISKKGSIVFYTS